MHTHTRLQILADEHYVSRKVLGCLEVVRIDEPWVATRGERGNPANVRGAEVDRDHTDAEWGEDLFGHVPLHDGVFKCEHELVPAKYQHKTHHGDRAVIRVLRAGYAVENRAVRTNIYPATKLRDEPHTTRALIGRDPFPRKS